MATTQAISTPTEYSVPPGMLENFVYRMVSLSGSPTSESPSRWLRTPGDEIRWSKPTIKALCNLPWGIENLPDSRKPPVLEAAAGLLALLTVVLEDETMPPTSIVPTSRGGVAAEWHVNGFDLEIEFDPEPHIEYNFAGPGVKEYEGPVDKDFQNLKDHVRMLPRSVDRYTQTQ